MRNWGLLFAVWTAILIAGCGGSNSSTGSSNTSGNGASTPSGANLTITTTSLPAGTVGTAYNAQVAASGGTTPYTYTAGGLPAGLSISSSTGAITGTPAASSAGTSSATIKVTDSTQPTALSATAAFNIKISSTTLAVTTTSLPAGTAGSPYPSTTLQASGGVPPYTWSVASGSNLPGGLNLSAAGTLTGTPSTAGSYPFTIVVKDSYTTPDTASAAFTLTIASATASLTLSPSTLPTAVLNTAYSTTLTATGGAAPYTFALTNNTSLPAGLSLSSTGGITGTPTAAGNTNFSVEVEDSTKPTPLTLTANLSLTVNPTAGPSCGNMSTGNGASLNGYVPFPSSNLWNTNIASAPVDTNSATIIAALTGSHLHPDFSNVVDGNYGIPYVVVDSSVTPGVPVTMTTYPSESDITLYPIPSTAPIEGFPPACSITGDNHLLVIDKNKCWLYETWQAELCTGTWSAANGAIWDLTSNEHRPYGWTSADAAGLPIFPGLVRYDEVAAGVINHAFRMTVAQTKSDSNGGYFVAPATHAAGNNSGTSNIMGMRLRLKAGFDISSFSAANQVILTAMKNYGMIVADNGSNMYFQGAPDARWDDNDLDALKNIDASNFEVVQMGTVYDDASAPTGAVPTISSFTASETTIAAGTAVTLSWATANDSYDFIDVVGPVRNGMQVVTPSATTTYTLNATNQYGRATKSVTVNVQ
ncbi:MAG TPA: putative Ig domain-containing protein [Acidobacteriaceae bacterium]|nr:putative Ig domain-containing protein [Acidobacteriaceae bacterium]